MIELKLCAIKIKLLGAFWVFPFVLGCILSTCRNFWESTDLGLVLSQKFLQMKNLHRNYFDGLLLFALQILRKNKFVILSASEVSLKNSLLNSTNFKDC